MKEWEDIHGSGHRVTSGAVQAVVNTGSRLGVKRVLFYIWPVNLWTSYFKSEAPKERIETCNLDGTNVTGIKEPVEKGKADGVWEVTEEHYKD